MDLYESRDYAGAREKFAECKKAFDTLDEIKGNYSALAGFYELETCRKLEDLTGGEKERAKDLVRQLGSEWAFALKVFEAKMRKLRQRDDHLRTRISHLLKQADA